MSDILQSAKNHALLRERLKAAFQLEDDDQTLIDSLEGESDFTEICAKVLRQALEREAMADAMDSLIERNMARRERHTEAAKRIRAIVAEAMIEAGERRFKTPDMTVSVRDGKPKLIINPDELWPAYTKTETVTKPDRDKIQAAVDRGEVPDGVQISNGGPSITVRSK